MKAMCIAIYLILTIIEIFAFRVVPFKTDKEIIYSVILLSPFRIIYKVLKFINDKLTITI